MSIHLTYNKWLGVVVSWATMLAVSPAIAEQAATMKLDPASVDSFVPVEKIQLAQAEPSENVVSQTDITASEPAEKPLPISLSVSYYLLSDYVFRGINFSEFEGEGREKLNHQIVTSLSWDAGDWGTIGFDTFWEWYAAQKELNPVSGGQNLQEIDYAIWWKHAVEPIQSDLTLGYTFYTFPNLAALLRTNRARGDNNDDRTTEWWFKLAHNDAWAWKWLFPNNEDGILNPTLLFAQDIGTGAGSTWTEISFSHPFTIPGVDNLTITPGYLIAVDGGYLRHIRGLEHAGHCRLAYDQWSLNATYDLTPVLHLPKWAGTVSVSGLLYYNNALGNAEDDGTINDEFWGGMSVNWAWGG